MDQKKERGKGKREEGEGKREGKRLGIECMDNSPQRFFNSLM